MEGIQQDVEAAGEMAPDKGSEPEQRSSKSEPRESALSALTKAIFKELLAGCGREKLVDERLKANRS